jgi:hypothetical protein
MARIAIIHPEGNINNNPNMAGIIDMLVEAGHLVDIYARRADHCDQRHPSSAVTVTLTSVPGEFDNDCPVLLPSIAKVDPHYAASEVSVHLPRPDVIIGVDRGIIEATALGREWGIPVGLISYEIWFADETSQQFKDPEIAACRDLDFVVCQDFVRGLALCTENRISEDKLINIPVAGRGVRRTERSKAIHELLGLDPSVRLALYMGELSGAWTGIDEILASTVNWPPGWVLVLHHRYGNGTAINLVSKVLRGARPNVVFSPFPSLPISEMSQLLSAVDVGIAFYRANPNNPMTGKNLSFIGMASGKFSTYLQHGVPVIINELGEMSDHVRRSGLGAVVSHGNQIPSALEKFSSHPGELNSERCYRFFAERLDVAVRGRPLLEKIQSLSSQPRAAGASAR